MTRSHPIDLLRGFIIILMIIDHAMVYCLSYSVSDPMTIDNTTPLVFFTRFSSHFCAPLFIFLAGLSASITENRYGSPHLFAKDLIVRGIVLIVLEFTLISWSWSFNPLFPMLYAQIIWAIGWGFIGLGLLRLAGVRAIFGVGIVLVFAHNLLDGLTFADNTAWHYLWSVLHQKNVLALPFDVKVRTTYPILPIVGLLCLGYLFGRHTANGTNQSLPKLTTALLWYGFICIAGYSLLRGFNVYGDPGLFTVYDSSLLTLMSFLNPTKYPLSLQFMLLTVGVGLVLLFFFSKLPSTFSLCFLQILGRASMFSYIVHLYLLHAMSWLLIPVMGYNYSDMTYNSTLIGLPEGYGFSYLETLLLVAVVVSVTTFLAKRYLHWKKANHKNLIARYI